MKKILVSLLLLSQICSAQTKVDLKKLEDYIENARVSLNIPGLAIAIVKNDSVVLCKGFGIRELGKTEEVDCNTNFAIASLSKAFTATSLGMLKDQGKISWDDYATDYIPAFRLKDPLATQELRVRDLLCHRSGLVTFAGDLIWFGTSHSKKEVLRRARYLEPKYSFRSQFGYSNILFLAAGEIIPAVTDTSWQDYVRTKILKPLGMKNTLVSVTEITPTTNIATPHTMLNYQPVIVPYRNWDNIAPAGALISNVNDMAQWIRFNLAKGKFNGKQLVSESTLREIWTPHTVIPVRPFSEKRNPTKHFEAAALGWMTYDYQGRKVIAHGGGYDGMISKIAFMPEANMGIIILTNTINSATDPLMNKIFDSYLGVPEKDWIAETVQLEKQYRQFDESEQKKDIASRVANTKPSHPLKDYSGAYVSQEYGKVEIKLNGEQLSINFVPTATFKGTLSHWHYDVFKVVLEDKNLPAGKVNFITGQDGKIERMVIDIPNPDFDFTELKLYKKS